MGLRFWLPEVKGRCVSHCCLLTPLLYPSGCPSLSILFTLSSFLSDSFALSLYRTSSLYSSLKAPTVSFPKVDNQNRFHLRLSFSFLPYLTPTFSRKKATSFPKPWFVQGPWVSGKDAKAQSREVMNTFCLSHLQLHHVSFKTLEPKIFKQQYLFNLRIFSALQTRQDLNMCLCLPKHPKSYHLQSPVTGNISFKFMTTHSRPQYWGRLL